MSTEKAEVLADLQTHKRAEASADDMVKCRSLRFLEMKVWGINRRMSY